VDEVMFPIKWPYGGLTLPQKSFHALQKHYKKHLKNVGPIRHCEPPHAHSPGVATVARRLCIDVHDNDDNNDNA